MLVGCSGLLRESLEAVKARGIPVVVIEGDAGDDVPRIGLDNREAQRQAASHLRALGHSRVAIVALPPRAGWERGWLADDERDHDRRHARAARGRAGGLPGCRRPTPPPAASSTRGTPPAGRSSRIPSDRPTAVIAQSDLLAAGVIRAAEEAGLRVPEDVSVTGFDGIVVDGLAPYVLTTLVQPATEKGRAAGEAVAAMLDGKAAASISFTCVFREGNTTGEAPRRRRR